MADVKDVKKVNKREFLKKYHKANKALEMWRIFKSNRLAVVGLLIFIVILLLMIFANVIADYKTVAIATNTPERLQSPSAAHLLGTDDLGRDMLARVIHGGRVSLRIAVGAGLLGLLLSGTIGSVAGFYGGAVDNILMR